MTLSFFVVDDEPDIVDLFEQRFRREVQSGECRLHFAQSGEQALRMIQEGISPEPILILTDINMPGMDGLELLERVKQHRPDLHVVMVTAYGDAERRRIAAERGATDYLVKPIDFTALKNLIREIGTNTVPLPSRREEPPGDAPLKGTVSLRAECPLHRCRTEQGYAADFSFSISAVTERPRRGSKSARSGPSRGW